MLFVFIINAKSQQGTDPRNSNRCALLHKLHGTIRTTNEFNVFETERKLTDKMWKNRTSRPVVNCLGNTQEIENLPKLFLFSSTFCVSKLHCSIKFSAIPMLIVISWINVWNSWDTLFSFHIHLFDVNNNIYSFTLFHSVIVSMIFSAHKYMKETKENMIT